MLLQRLKYRLASRLDCHFWLLTWLWALATALCVVDSCTDHIWVCAVFPFLLEKLHNLFEKFSSHLYCWRLHTKILPIFNSVGNLGPLMLVFNLLYSMGNLPTLHVFLYHNFLTRRVCDGITNAKYNFHYANSAVLGVIVTSVPDVQFLASCCCMPFTCVLMYPASFKPVSGKLLILLKKQI